MADPRPGTGHGYTCQEIVELATEYLEGHMGTDQRTAFEVHLNFCDGCVTFVDQVRVTAAASRVLPDAEIPETVRMQLLSAFRDWKRQ